MEIKVQNLHQKFPFLKILSELLTNIGIVVFIISLFVAGFIITNSILLWLYALALVVGGALIGFIFCILGEQIKVQLEQLKETNKSNEYLKVLVLLKKDKEDTIFINGIEVKAD